ncbi:PREDICTED: protein MOTHER of FT and TFL1-like [Theobroma cacao]|uniref:Protein MOTHER of FT and TFL1-like n=1 Tax=Theobroma cacao TaxID=3641 RepID=A0AB32WHX1_THECC|nr:PREDICTED: protein MOTHER of FT and TFL1-like [Theobroma cacao]
MDPDAPTPSELRLKEWLYWIVVDIPEGHDATKGIAFLFYSLISKTLLLIIEDESIDFQITLHGIYMIQYCDIGNTGREMAPYMGPLPPTGIHRCILALFKQERATGGGCRLPDARANFITRQFAAQSRPGLPFAAVYFNSQKEPAMKKR